MRSINLAMTNCLENKYINIYIWKNIYVLREMLAKKGVSILIEMTGEWEFHYLFFFFNDLFSNEMFFLLFLFTFFFLIESRLFTLKYKENSLETLD